MINMIIRDKGIKFDEFYKLNPFKLNPNLQTEGNVIQYLMMLFSKDCQAKTPLEQTKNIFTYLMIAINTNTISSFSSKDCATTLNRIAHCITKNKSLSEVPDLPEKVNLLLVQLHKVRFLASYQAISNGLWAVAKLLDFRKDLHLNLTHVEELICSLNNQSKQATAQAIANTLWATARLVREKMNLSINVPVLVNLINALHAQREHPETITQNIVNSLWAIAELIQAGYVIPIPEKIVNELYDEIFDEKRTANKRDKDSINWAKKVILSQNSIEQCNNNNNTFFSNANNKSYQQQNNEAVSTVNYTKN